MKNDFRTKFINMNFELTQKSKIKPLLMLKSLYYSMVFYQNRKIIIGNLINN